MSDPIQTTIVDLLRRQTEAVEQRLRALLTARGIDPDDRTDGWEDRAREALADLEIVESVDMSDPYRMTATTEIRPRKP